MTTRPEQPARRLACFTIDLEPDFLSEDCHEVLLDDGRMARLRDFFTGHGISPTVFAVGRMLEQGLSIRERFEGIDAEFELHSYSHRPDAPDSEEEIARGVAAFRGYFGRPPRGYRAPLGRIGADGVARLARHGFAYDASVFPARRPELGYDFSTLPTAPWRWAEHPEIVEIPFAVASPLRFVVSVSFLKLMGLRFFEMVFRATGFPPRLVLDSHLYDFFETSPVRRLSRLDWRRHALLRNQERVLPLMDGFVGLLVRNGYEFVSVGRLHDLLVADRGSLPSVSVEALRRGCRRWSPPAAASARPARTGAAVRAENPHSTRP
jgi:hypothetical protein